VKGAVPAFETPQRVPISTEVNAKIDLHFDDPWDNPVFEAANRFDKAEWLAALHSKNGRYAAKLRDVRGHVNRFTGYALTKYYPHIGYPGPLSERDVRILVELQIEAGCNVISIPEPSSNCTAPAFGSNLEKFWEYSSRLNPDVAVMPYINIAQDPARFKAKLKVIADHEHALWSLGLVYASPTHYRPNFLHVAEFGHHDVWIHCSGVRKYQSYVHPVSQLHSVQFFGVDSVALAVPRAFFTRAGQDTGAMPVPTPSPGDIRYFVPNSLNYPKLSQLCDGGKPLPCTCPACGGKTLDDTVAGLATLGTGDEPTFQTRALSKIHDVYASTTEFDVARTEIKESRLAEYYTAKPAMKAFLGIP
jgi:hypothetical protein